MEQVLSVQSSVGILVFIGTPDVVVDMAEAQNDGNGTFDEGGYEGKDELERRSLTS